MGFAEAFVMAVAYVFPTYVANGAPVVFVKIIERSTPLDRGAVAWDGRRVLGDGKTVEGLLSALVSGFLTGVLLILAGNPGGFRTPLEPLTLSAGTMLGDLAGSFFKRRIGLERGKSAPILDQLGFLLTALLLAYLIHGVPRWFRFDVLLCLLALTGGLHVTTNALAYILKLKDKPY